MIRVLRRRIANAATEIRRTTPAAATVRLLAALAALAAMLVALPTSLLFGRTGPALVLVAALAAAGVGLFPRGRWVSVVIIVAAAAWLVAGVAFLNPATPLRIGGLAALLYLTHVAAAFAAVLPHDVVVAPGVLLRWARRQALVLVVGVMVGLVGLFVAQLVPATPTLIGPLLGAAVAAGLAALLASLIRTRSTL